MRIKNFSHFQHFKDRSPPWVKLYRDLLDDPDWHDLDPRSAKVLVMLWLIASEDETRTGTLPDSRKLCFRLRITEKELKQHLNNLYHWLEHDDINVISSRYRPDAPERAGEETETETEESCAEAHKIDFDGKQFQNLNGHLQAWGGAFPAIDVQAEIRKAEVWLVANPRNRKSNYARFLTNWLTKAQDKAPPLGGGKVAPSVSTPHIPGLL